MGKGAEIQAKPATLGSSNAAVSSWVRIILGMSIPSTCKQKQKKKIKDKWKRKEISKIIINLCVTTWLLP